MARDPWWGRPLLTEGNYDKRTYLRIPKGTIIMARPIVHRSKKKFISYGGAIVWKADEPYTGGEFVPFGTHAVYLGRKGLEISVLIDGRVMLSSANRWCVVDPPQKLRKGSQKGVLVS